MRRRFFVSMLWRMMALLSPAGNAAAARAGFGDGEGVAGGSALGSIGKARFRSRMGIVYC